MSPRTARLPGIAVGALSLALLGCQASAPREEQVSGELVQALEEGIASQPAPAPPPAAVTSALLPSIAVDTGRVDEVLDQRFQISVKDAPAQQFFMSLVDGTQFNMVVHPEVDGAVTLELKNVTIPEVMDIVRDVYGYEFTRTARGFEVLPRRLRSRIYQVDFLNLRRVGSSQTRVSSGQVTQSAGGTTIDDGGATTTTSSRATNVTGTQINTLQPETSFWEEMQASVEAILGQAPGRSVVVNPQSGVVVVRAMPNELREVEEFLVMAQAIAQRQVILEAKILEVQLDDQYRQGIDWSLALRPGPGKTVTGTQLGGAGLTRQSVAGAGPGFGALGGELLAPFAGAITTGTGFGGVFTLALALNDFNAFIALLDQQGTVHTLSSPRVATLNNQKAVIKVGTDEFFVTDVSSTTTTGTTTTTTPSIEFTPFFSGVALDVTPQISGEGDVLLHIHPTISRVQDQQKAITIGPITQSIPLALSTVRESDTVVRAQSGQVIVIGGLMENLYEGDAADTPLSGAPVVGPLFGQRRQAVGKTELVILLRPVVVQSGQQWARAMRGSADRIDHIRRLGRELRGAAAY